MRSALPATTDTAALKARAAALWEADRAQLMLRQPFLALLAMQLELVPVVDVRLDTAATDGERVFANAEFLLSLSASERLFVLAHEVWHCAALHFLRRGEREGRLWNLAADHEVNALLEEQGLKPPQGVILYPQLRGQNAETVYDWLQRNPEAEQDRGPLADQHDWQLSPQANGRLDPDYSPGTGAWRAWPARALAAAQQIERQAGSLPAGVQRQVDALRQPQLPWQEVLRQFVSRALDSERRWTPPSRRFISQGLYLPGIRRRDALELTVAVDTSGSTQSDLADFLSELVGIVSAFGEYRLRLLMCDAAVHSDSVYDPLTPLDPKHLEFTGGGGTSFHPVFERLASSERPQLLAFFTDGFGAAPEQPPAYPVLWVLTADGAEPANWGETLRLPARLTQTGRARDL